MRDGGPLRHAIEAAAQARALRDDCLAWLPSAARRMMPVFDAITRRWLMRSHSPYVAEIAAIAAALEFSGVWFLNGSYQWGCTSLARDDDAPWLVRTLDWPFPGLGRHVEIARMAGRAGEYYSVTWPGFVGVLTGMAPGRFAASINQAPLWRRTRASVAAAARHHGERARDLAGAAYAAGPVAARDVRDLPRLRQREAAARDGADRAAGDLHARRVQAGRTLRDRAHHRRLQHAHRGHRRCERLAGAGETMGRPHRRQHHAHRQPRGGRGQEQRAARRAGGVERAVRRRLRLGQSAGAQSLHAHRNRDVRGAGHPARDRLRDRARLRAAADGDRSRARLSRVRTSRAASASPN